MATETTPRVGVDGRNARASRTRRAVVSALLALIEDGDLRPTARRVADRAGVSLRSVYVHFDDLEDLFRAAAEQQFRKISELVVPLATEGPLDARLDAFVDQRVKVLESGAAVRRAAVVQAPASPTLARVLDMSRRAGRVETERVFHIELDRLDAPARRELLAALVTIASGGTWESLRVGEGIDATTARGVMHRMLRGVLEQSDRGRGSPGSRPI
ncbi:MAG: TetR/AcrR family transcriptional regulator [Actinobacteria bacterium]|nr:TetR/AcrR family transcriptional regulator [Actinomycetota bacterium]